MRTLEHLKPCCNKDPKFKIVYIGLSDLGMIECPVCGKHTDLYEMYWLAHDAWNDGKFSDYQVKLFE